MGTSTFTVYWLKFLTFPSCFFPPHPTHIAAERRVREYLSATAWVWILAEQWTLYSLETMARFLHPSVSIRFPTHRKWVAEYLHQRVVGKIKSRMCLINIACVKHKEGPFTKDLTNLSLLNCKLFFCSLPPLDGTPEDPVAFRCKFLITN